jgi:hypothetical protein
VIRVDDAETIAAFSSTTWTPRGRVRRLYEDLSPTLTFLPTRGAPARRVARAAPAVLFRRRRNRPPLGAGSFIGCRCLTVDASGAPSNTWSEATLETSAPPRGSRDRFGALHNAFGFDAQPAPPGTRTRLVLASAAEYACPGRWCYDRRSTPPWLLGAGGELGGVSARWRCLARE